jgi:hypothetical protein
MEIKGLDYNTQREKLVMPEYGREIQKMVDLAITLPTKEERNDCAHAIIRLMENMNVQLRTTPDYEQTLWDHLYLMSHKELDIDWPYDVNQAEKILAKPQPLQHPAQDEQAHMRHYGRLLSKVFEKLKTMPEGPERDELVRQTANQMKRDDDLARFTDGKIQLDLQTFRFNAVSVAVDNGNNGGKRKRKK